MAIYEEPTLGEFNYGDLVYEITNGWKRERPDLDAWPIGVWGRVKRLDALLEQALAPYFARYRVGGKEFELLSALRRSGVPYAASPTELARTLIVPAATMTKRLDRLEQAGLVSRAPHPEDRRAIVINLTSKGLRTSDELVELVVRETGRLLGPVASQRDLLNDLLHTALVGITAPADDER